MTLPNNASPVVCASCGGTWDPGCDGEVCPRCAFASVLSGGGQAPANSSEAVSVPGEFDVLSKLGQGANATVWLARERQLNRLVALKLIPTRLEPLLTLRLVREAHALASLRHPNIVVVHSLTTTDTHTCLAMDYLEGGDLKVKLRDQRVLAPKEATALIKKLADALTYAHNAGILHRDIKPSNILLDAQGVPRLANFGLAVPLEGMGDLTRVGQVAGTAAYLAPELLEGSQRASPQSDLYGLGAVLYECLTGRAPFIGDSTAAILAQVVGTEPVAPRLLRPDVPRDLETICLKCLEKSRDRRYASAQELREDLERWEDGKPIAARPVGALGRSLRWCRRNPILATSASVAMSAILALAIGGPIVAMKFNRARARTASEAEISKAESDFLQNDLLAQASPENQPDRNLKLSTVLDAASNKIGSRFVNQPQVEASIRETLAKTYSSLGDYPKAQIHLERALQIRRQQLGPEDARTLSLMVSLVLVLQSESKLSEAEALAKETLAIEQRTLGPENPATLSAMSELAVVYEWQGRYAESEDLAARTLELRKRVLGPEHPDTLKSLNNLGIIYWQRGKLSEAEELETRTVEIKRRVLGPEHPSTLNSLHNLSATYGDDAKFLESLAIAEPLVAVRKRVLGEEHPSTLTSEHTLAHDYLALGRFAEATALDAFARDVDERKLGPDHIDSLTVSVGLAMDYAAADRFKEADLLLSRTLDAQKRILGPEHPRTLLSMYLLAQLYQSEGRATEALAIASKSFELHQRVLGSKHFETLDSADLLGSLLLKVGRPSEAEPILRRSLEVRIETGPQRWETAATQSLLGTALLGMGRFEEAEPLLLKGYAGLRETKDRIPVRFQPTVAEAGARIVQLYSDQNLAGKAEDWKRQLAIAAP